MGISVRGAFQADRSARVKWEGAREMSLRVIRTDHIGPWRQRGRTSFL